MRGRFAIALPYLIFAAIAGLIAYDNIDRSQTVESVAAAETAPTDPVCGMRVDPASAVSITADGETRYFCSTLCRDHFVSGDRELRSAERKPGALRDPVCNMDVNRAWGYHVEHERAHYWFCSARCRDRFAADPETFLADRCIVCGAPLAGVTPWTATYQGETYGACSEAHRAAFLADPGSYFLHHMWGIPSGLYYGSIALVLVVSFAGLEWRNRLRARTAATVALPENDRGRSGASTAFTAVRLEASGTGGVATLAPPARVRPRTGSSNGHGPMPPPAPEPRLDLLRTFPRLARALRWPPTRFIAQAGIAGLFLLIIAAGLFGNQNPALNIAPILTWTLWWGGLVLLIMVAGKAWCYVCPWDALAGWLERGRLWGTGAGMSLGWRWPKALRNIWPATVLFILLTWVELGWGVTMRPRVTAYLALAMFALAFACALLFDRQSFCRYACLVGRVSGLYALFGGMEVRARDKAVCKGCRTKDCYHGNANGDGCPTFEFPGAMDLNTYCIMCGECLKTCPEDNIAVNLRPWGADLLKRGRPRSDEAYLALLMLAITAFHGLTMTPRWTAMTDWLAGATGLPAAAVFSIGMTGIMIGPILIYAALVGLSWALARSREVAYRTYFIRYAYALLPIALFYHLAHNSEHLLMEGPKVFRLLSDPFGLGWNVFGTAALAPPPLLSLHTLWYVQIALVLVGHVYGLWVADHTARQMFSTRRGAFRSQLPMLAGMVLFSVFSLWLLKQPMVMRTSAM